MRPKDASRPTACHGEPDTAQGVDTAQGSASNPTPHYRLRQAKALSRFKLASGMRAPASADASMGTAHQQAPPAFTGLHLAAASRGRRTV